MAKDEKRPRTACSELALRRSAGFVPRLARDGFAWVIQPSVRGELIAGCRHTAARSSQTRDGIRVMTLEALVR